MTIIITIGIITFIIYALTRTKQSPPLTDYTGLGQQEKELKGKLLHSQDTKTAMTNSGNKHIDDSIIDVTGNYISLNRDGDLRKYRNGVPYWAHHYVYSYSEIESATKEQKTFYEVFKSNFLCGVNLDLEGNNNYAFILLFDLLIEYERHKDIPHLEKQLKTLGKYYPKTKSYGIAFLVKRMEAKGDVDGISRIQVEDRYINQNSNVDSDYWKLGAKYKTKLNLNKDEVLLLNKLWYPDNNFSSIEFCRIAILKLYISTIAQLVHQYVQEGTTLHLQFTAVADVIARKHFKYKAGSNNYKYCIESTTNDIYSIIFKHCENAVREHYGHKRKINTETSYTTLEARTEFESKIIDKVKGVLPILVSKIPQPDETTEILLNFQNTSRWKIRFEELTSTYKGSAKDFIEAIISLGKLNKKNPSVENIFFEASKFIAKESKEASLALYVHYLYHDLKSATFDNKQLNKTIHKSLFKTNEQLHSFEIIVSELIKDKDLEKALQGVSKIYAAKRKKIQLDENSIKVVQQQDFGTVELLNEYLKDDYEDENNVIKTQQINNEEVSIHITQKAQEAEHSIYVTNVSFTGLQASALELFTKSNFSVPQDDLAVFAKSKGVFMNQLIEHINETCYETLDDILIEEEDEHYSINPNYYQKLLAK